MNEKLDLRPDYLEIIRDIFKKHFSSPLKVWIFGSRVTGKAKKFSDVDLVIDNGQAIPISILANLNNDFEQSNLPYKVDIVDWHSINDLFKERIQRDKIQIL